MIEGIRRFFGERLAREEGNRAPDRRLEVATCALLLEAAHADEELDAQEKQAIVDLVRQRFGLAADEVEQLLAQAEQERGASTGVYDFTRLISEAWDRRERQALLALVWRVVYSDGRLEAHEDALMHKLAHLLGLSHQELIALKLKVKGEQSPPAAPGAA